MSKRRQFELELETLIGEATDKDYREKMFKLLQEVIDETLELQKPNAKYLGNKYP